MNIGEMAGLHYDEAILNTIGKAVALDPVMFVEDILGRQPWRVQKEILRSLRDNQRTAVRSCHGIGKTFVAASAILWFLFTHRNSIVISTAPSWRQVEKVIWKEIRSAYRDAHFPLGGYILPKTPELNIVPNEWYAAGLSTNEPDKFQGFHEDHLLVVVDEAAGVREDIFNAIEGVLTSRGARLLLLGNPTSLGGTFYHAFKVPTFNKIHVSAFDTPNFTRFGITPEDIMSGEYKTKIGSAELPNPRLITPEWVRGRYLEWGTESPVWQSRVMGNFPEQDENTLIPLVWIELAMERWEETELGEPVEVGVDVAAFGQDKTAIAVKCGQKIDTLRVYAKKSTTETAGLAKKAAEEYGTNVIRVDEIGVGRGVVDNLEEQGYKEVGINVSERARDPERFVNLRSELWWNLRERLDPDTERNPVPLALPPDDELLSDLASIHYKFTARGAIQIESKDEMKKRLGHSPDRADAVVLAAAPKDWSGFAFSGGKSISAGMFSGR